MSKKYNGACLCLLLFLIQGCASTGMNPAAVDPLERYNRKMYKINENIDAYFMQPLALAYRDLMPDSIEKGVHNFFSNINDLPIALNNLFQLKFKNAASDVGRVLVNSTLGFAGFYDPASHLSLKKHDEDLGQTLGFWGVRTGPYVVLPFFGPSNVRDSFGLVGDTLTDPLMLANWYLNREYYAVSTVKYIDKRVALLEITDMLDEVSMGDNYGFVKDSYLQLRTFKIYDGNPPEELSDDELSEDDLEDDMEL
ncbi:MAG: VacJ family lipoprotein [Methylococcales bacterium]|jgi:phospholipid-binding lipoprotein MlaA|nr:VacJ family lipoprotein [Methylococcales bacterium]MBT7408439.1 VacJ family lipoprotein [Methylococcales bacterium]